jgi:hypothetical protein
MGSYIFFCFLCGVFVRFSTRGIQKHHKKKLLGKRPPSLSFFPLRFCFVVFLAVSLHEELKNAIQKRVCRCPGRYVAFFSLSAHVPKKGNDPRRSRRVQGPGPGPRAPGPSKPQTSKGQQAAWAVNAYAIHRGSRGARSMVYPGATSQLLARITA